MRADIVPGAAFPDYELPDHTETPRTLSEIQGDDPMILTLAPATTARKSTSSTSSRAHPEDRSGIHAGRDDLDRRAP
jgi:peroxiredoxin